MSYDDDDDDDDDPAFSRFDTIPACGRRTDRETDRRTDGRNCCS